MIKMWIQPDDCTGCGACANICPKQAIEMHEDNCGFVHPVIGKNCVDCGMCRKVCESRTQLKCDDNTEPSFWAAYSSDSVNRFHSTSGGIFYELARQTIHKGGVVYGAGYDEKNVVRHIRADCIEELDNIRQSKYVQSETGNIFSDVKKDLVKNINVLFCGTPCQIAGLKSYLKKDYPSLVTADFICRGVNSPKAYRCWLSEIESQQKEKATRVWFKYKEFGWRASPLCTRIDFEHGRNCVLHNENNLFMQGYLKYNLYLRPSCSHCDFKDKKRISDITLSDFWGCSDDDDKGTSCIIINNSKGYKLFSSVSEHIVSYQISEQQTNKNNACNTKSVEINPNSRLFLKSIGKNNFTDYFNRFSTHEKITSKQYFLIVFKQHFRDATKK